MCKLTGVFVCLLLMSAGPGDAFAQSSVPAFDLEAITVGGAQSGQGRLDLYTKIPYSRLQFISQSGGFVAQYEVMAEVFRVDEKGRQQGVALSRIWERSVPRVEVYAHTQSDTLYDIATYSETALAPGLYILEVQIEDKIASTTFVQKMPIEVRDLNKPVALSDLLIADTYDIQTRRVKPNVCNTVDQSEQQFALFFEIHARQPTQVYTSYTIFRLKGRSKPSVRSLFSRRKASEKFADVSFEREELLTLRAGKNPAAINIPIANFQVGDYLIRTQIKDENGELLDTAEKTITIRWTGLAQQISDIDDAIEQMDYIAKRDDIKWIKQGDSKAERLRRFDAFWKRRDPTPGTVRNEYMEEYYYRVSYANRRYGQFGKGWQTDRGLVLIHFGEPDYIQKHPYGFGANKPYEIWMYPSIGRRFFFIDNTGVGDFELLVPIWDERTRLR